MPDEPTPAPAPEAAAPSPDAPTTAELMATIEQERLARLQAEQEAQRANAMLYSRPAGQPEAQAPQNPLGGVMSDFITNPDQAARGLQGHIRSEAERAANTAAANAYAAAQRDMKAQQEQMYLANLLNNAKMAVPDFQDEAKLGAAITEAQISARKQGLNLNPEQIVDRAIRMRRAANPQAAQRPPYVEGSGMGGSPGSPINAPPEPTQQTMLEEMYDADAGDIIPLNSANIAEFTAKSVMADNAERAKHGITPSGSVRLPRERKLTKTA